ncbi:MAG: hypothetical protein AAFX04_02290 [Pseudomonadota bacterium]
MTGIFSELDQQKIQQSIPGELGQAAKALSDGLQAGDLAAVRAAHADVRRHYAVLRQDSGWMRDRDAASRLRKLIELLSRADRFLIESGSRPRPESRPDEAAGDDAMAQHGSQPIGNGDRPTSEISQLAVRTRALQNIRRELAAYRRTTFKRQAG